ncbi:unnamed protein product [Citrullus colocynthis]|uniref:Uncharacterized protein n=1 Tax=Citrullus colocynthis TaxID=252529 RepID=A0ABP0XLG5_9ROSI
MSFLLHFQTSNSRIHAHFPSKEEITRCRRRYRHDQQSVLQLSAFRPSFLDYRIGPSFTTLSQSRLSQNKMSFRIGKEAERLGKDKAFAFNIETKGSWKIDKAKGALKHPLSKA